MGETDDLLAGQRAYYAARAPEYDDWWNRRGRYDHGAEHTAAWEADIAEAHARLDRFSPVGRVLELAAGTGNWTARLARHADQVVAVDGSQETLAINREKLGRRAGKVDYVVADLFAWEPADRFDVVFMGFWLTHVPDSRFDGFWAMVATALRPGGRVFLIDSAHPGPDAGDTTNRTLADGRTFEIVKRYWELEELRDRLAALGWAADVEPTSQFFLTAEGARS